MQVDYPTLAKTIASLTEGEDDAVALMATVACEVHHSDDRFDWTGFYRVTGPEMLKIGPYPGRPWLPANPVCARGLRRSGAHGAGAAGPRCGRLPGPYRLRCLDKIRACAAGLEQRERPDRGPRYRQRSAGCLHGDRCGGTGDDPGRHVSGLTQRPLLSAAPPRFYLPARNQAEGAGHRQAVPRPGDLAELGAEIGARPDLAGIKRIGSKVGSPVPGLPMPGLCCA